MTQFLNTVPNCQKREDKLIFKADKINSVPSWQQALNVGWVDSKKAGLNGKGGPK